MPDHPAIARAAAELDRQSKNHLEFARKAYEYVVKNFRYRDAYTGAHPMDKIIANNGGDCVNLSSVFVSLLRNRGIPARHLVGIRPNDILHVYAEFHLEGYGWIPVDVTYGQRRQNNDCFGKVRSQDAIVILSRDLGLTVKTAGDKTQTLDMVQKYNYWFWLNKGNTSDVKIKRDFSFSGERSDGK